MFFKIFIRWMPLVLLVSCVAQKKMVESGTLQGTLGLLEGNCMPGPGRPPCKPVPLSDWVYISQLSHRFDLNLVVDSVKSDDKGEFSVLLEPGSYSLFVRDGDQVVCTLEKCPGECVCLPIKIVKDSTTQVDLSLNHAVW